MDAEFIKDIAINAIGALIASAIGGTFAAIIGRRIMGAQTQNNATANSTPPPQAAHQPTYTEAPQPIYAEKPKRQGARNGRARWAIWTGAGSFIPYFLGPLALLAPAMAVAAIVFGFQSFKQQGGRFKAWGGILLGLVNLAGLCLVIFVIAITSATASSASGYQPSCYFDPYWGWQCF